MPRDWDDAYANSAHIPGAETIAAAWAPDAAAYRAKAHARLDVPYGPGARQKFDLFLPEGVPKGLVVFIHGGYWMLFDKSSWSHFATGPLERGFACAVPSYELAPAARVGAIARQMAAAIVAAAREVAGPIFLTGHSAGGHLAARMMCGTPLLPAEVFARVKRVVAISGLFDLRPFMRTKMNESLKLDLAETRAESPALLEPIAGSDFVAWVGENERPEFRRQSALIANAWSGFDVAAREAIAPGRHHFDVIDPMRDPASALVEALVG